MKIAYWDCFSGVSGDMLLGALVACGAELSELEQAVRQLGLDGVRWRKESVKRGPLMATQVLIEAGANPPSRAYRLISDRAVSNCSGRHPEASSFLNSPSSIRVVSSSTRSRRSNSISEFGIIAPVTW